MAALTSQSIDITGTAITLAAAAGGGDSWIPTGDDRTFLWVKNGGGGSITVTVTVGGTTYEQANPDAATVVPNAAERLIGPLVPALATTDTLGVIFFSYTGVTSVTVAVVNVGLPSAQLPT